MRNPEARGSQSANYSYEIENQTSTVTFDLKLKNKTFKVTIRTCPGSVRTTAVDNSGHVNGLVIKLKGNNIHADGESPAVFMKTDKICKKIIVHDGIVGCETAPALREWSGSERDNTYVVDGKITAHEFWSEDEFVESLIFPIGSDCKVDITALNAEFFNTI